MPPIPPAASPTDRDRTTGRRDAIDTANTPGTVTPPVTTPDTATTQTTPGSVGWVMGTGQVRRADGVGSVGTVPPPAANTGIVAPGPGLLLPMGEGGDFGPLNPTGKTFTLPSSVDKLIKPTNDALDLDVLNRDYNPLKAKGVMGDYKSADEVFQGKAVIPTRDIIGGIVKQLGPQGAALAPMVAALPQASVMRTPAQEFNIDGEPGQTGKPGNRIVFYGGDHEKASSVQGTVSDVDQLAMKLGDKGTRLMKEMVHFNGPGQGGTISDIMSDGVGGATHGGGFSSGYIDGKQTSVYSDWPANYGRLSNDNEHYNAHLFAINYQGGVEKPLPREEQVQYKNNADMWDAVLGAVVPFANEDPDPRHTNYQYNPLDVSDQASLKSLAHDAADMNWDTMKTKHGAFYCAEGQYVVANLGPQEDTLLKKSLFEKKADGSTTKLGDMINTFQEAYPNKSDENRKHPEVGWKHLVDTGKITQNQYDNLKQTGRLATYLDWIPEDTEGWQKFGPVDKKNQLIAEPMTVGTLAWSLVHRYMPRDGIASQLSSDMLNTYKTGTPEVKKGIETMLGGNDPTTPAGQKALGALSFKASTGTLAQMIANPDFKKRLFQQAGYEEITNDADKAAVGKAYDKFVGALMTAKDQPELDRALSSADQELRDLKVHRSTVDASGNQTGEVVESTMLYAAPPSIAAWAQNPQLAGGPQVLQYVATAMHAAQEKKPAAPAQ